MPNIGNDSPIGGLRGNIMRTPGQRQQNFALEGVDQRSGGRGGDRSRWQFRLAHTTDQRLIDIINATAKAAGWESRPSPRKQARSTGTDPVTGRGVAIMIRTNAYWVGIAEVSVTPSTGVVQVTKFTIGAECGKIINPRQLDRCMRAARSWG